MTHINQTAFGLACGILWGAGLAFLSISSMYFGYGTEIVNFIGKIYLGVNATWLGALFAFLWAFADGFIGGWILAWLYNQFS